MIIALDFYFGVKFAESTETFLPFCSNYGKRRRSVLKITGQLENCAFNGLIDEHSKKVSRKTLISFKTCRNDQPQTVLDRVSECGTNTLPKGNWCDLHQEIAMRLASSYMKTNYFFLII